MLLQLRAISSASFNVPHLESIPAPSLVGMGPEDPTDWAGIMTNAERCLAPPQTVVTRDG